ncbi:MAG: hypothetical protein J6X95_01325 [Treponema sp.]|nr:hypothetical protein [Treponema sp.]
MTSALATALRTNGYIKAEKPISICERKPSEEKISVDDFVAQITTIFLPHLPAEMSDRDFSGLENSVKAAAIKFKRGKIK